MLLENQVKRKKARVTKGNKQRPLYQFFQVNSSPVEIRILGFSFLIVILLAGAAFAQTSNSNSVLQSLTEEERVWLREHPVIRVVQDSNWPPVEFADQHGEPSGIANDYLELVEQRLGVKFESVHNLEWKEAYARLKRRDLDMTTCVAVTPERAEFWAFTKPYIKIPIVILTRADVIYISDLHELAGKRIAVVDGYVAGEWIARDFPEVKLVKVKNVKEGILLLQRRDVFAFVDSMLVINYYRVKLKLSNLKFAGQTPYVNAQCMAVRKDWPILAGILQKALDSIPESRRLEIYQKWVPARYKYGLDYSFLWKLLAIFAVILGGLFVWNLKLSWEIKNRKTSDALRQSEQRMATLISNLPGFIYRCVNDRSWTMEYISAGCLDITGYKPEDFLQNKKLAYNDIIRSDFRDSIWGNWQESLERKEPFEGEYPIITSSGETRWVWERGRGIFTQSGELSALEGFITDITERKQAENELRASKQIIEGIINSIPVRVFWKDKNLVYLGCNEIFARDAGFADPKDIIGKDDYQMGWKDQAELYRKDDLEVISSGLSKLLIEEPQTTPKGEAITLLTSKLPLRDSKGEIVGIIGTYMDITERQKVHDELQQAYKQLKETQDQLIQTSKMSALGQLAGGIAHELNNPLTGVLNNVQLIRMEMEVKKDFSPNDFTELLAVVESSALRCKKVTQSLLDFSYAAKGKMSAVSLNELVDKTIELVLNELRLENVSFKKELQPILPLIQGDPQLLQQVVFGLINNAQWAIKKKSQEGGVITIKTWNDPKKKTVGLSISDNGIGISQENIAKLFTPFFTTKEIGEGTGLGLALFYNIIKSQNGTITTESRLGEGTTFAINLPY
jgi:PAS domain S-box-containing protein